MSFSRIKPRITPSSSFAQMMKTSAIGELVIQFLEPLWMVVQGVWMVVQGVNLDGLYCRQLYQRW